MIRGYRLNRAVAHVAAAIASFAALLPASAEGLGTADVSRDGGRYCLVVPAGVNRALTALHPTLDEKGTATITSVAPESVTAIDIVVRPVPPRIVSQSPAPGAVDQPVGSVVAVLFSEALDPASVSASTLALQLLDGLGNPTGAFFAGAVSLTADRLQIVFTPKYPLPPGRTYLASFAGGVRDAGGTPYAGPVPVEWRFSTSMVVAPGGQVHPEKFHVRVPVNGVAQIYGDPGALPLPAPAQAAWAVSPEIEGPVADPVRDTFPAATDGSFRGTVGHPPVFAVTIASKVWVTMLDSAGQVAARFRVTPFTSADGKGFVAPPGEAVTYTTADGITVDVPAGAFDLPTAVTITSLPPDSLGIATPTGMALGAYVNVDFDGEAHETLRLKVPAPAGAVAGSKVFVGTPQGFPWGQKLRLLTIGGVKDVGGRLFMTNDPDLQPEPAPAAGKVGAELVSARASAQNAGAGKLLPYAAGATTCADAKKTGLSKCFLQSVFMEFSAATTAAWFTTTGDGFGLVSGTIAQDLGAQFSAVYNDLADTFVYVPRPHDWNGHYVLPIAFNTPFRVVQRDIATGWLLTQQAYDPLAPGLIGLIEKGLLAGPESARPLLIDARPFSLVHFSAPRAGQRAGITLQVDATTSDHGTSTLLPVSEFPLADQTQIGIYDYAPALPEDPAAQPQTPVHLFPRSGEACVGIACLPSEEFPASNHLVLLLHPGELDWDVSSAFEFQFDKALDGTQTADLPGLVKLVDLASQADVPLTTDLVAGKTRLVARPDGFLIAGHQYRLSIVHPDLLRTSAGKAFWGEPHEFFFAVRSVRGEPVTNPAAGVPSLGDTNDARDMLPFGNLLMVASATGRLLAIDRTQPSTDATQLGRYRLLAVRNGKDDEIRALAADAHNRLFYAALSGSTWAIKAVRIEDVEQAASGACAGQPAWAAPLGCFDAVIGGVRVATALAPADGTTASEWLTLKTLPAGIPMDLEVLSQDENEAAQDLDAFYASHAGADKTDLGGGAYRFTIGLTATYEAPPACDAEQGLSRTQRITVDDVSTMQNWSFDVKGSKRVTLTARAGDMLRVRRNVNTLGYVAVLGSGITVVDLNRFYGTPMVPGAFNLSQCGRRLGSYEGQDIAWPTCALPGGDPANASALNGIALTPSVAPISQTGCPDGRTGCRGSTSIDVYSPRVHIGIVHSSSGISEPGGLMANDLDGCMTQIGGERVQLRDTVVAPETTWVDRGIRGTSAGVFADPPPKFVAKDTTGDLLFASLGPAGVLVYDISERAFNVIGRLHVAGHAIFRLQVDAAHGLLFAGGYDAAWRPVIDLYDLRLVNGAPGKSSAPQPVVTLNASWTTNHLAVDPSGTGLLDTWESGHGALAVPYSGPRMIFTRLLAPAVAGGAPSADPKARLAPLGIPMETTIAQEQANRVTNERKAAAAVKLRVALPGALQERLTVKVQSVRAVPEKTLLARRDLGRAVALPGGPGWPERDVLVTLRRVVGAAGTSDRYAGAYNWYESEESVVLEADPRARHAYTRQLSDGKADEATQCRRCEWPAYLPNDGTVKELLVGGRYVRAFLAVDEAKPVGDPIRQATQAALDFFRAQAGNYPPPYGLEILPAWADEVPSPIQASFAEPAQNPAYWSPNEAGVSVSLVAGEALLSTSDFWWQGRALPLSLDRTYRSGTLGYGPLGSAGWSSTVFAHLREIGTTGEVEYHDGRGNVFRFLPPGTLPPVGYEADQPSTYVVPRGLSLRLRKVGLEQGWQLFDRHHNVMTFDAEGKLVEIADRHRQGAAANRQGNTVRFHHDVFGQLLSIEDDYGRTYAFEYYDNPKPVGEGGDGMRYGLLKRVTDFAGRTIEYEWDESRRLINVKLPEVTNPVADYSQFSYTGANRPTIQYRYYESGQWSVTSGQPATSATLHGDFAKLRLEGFIQPGGSVLRARFEYDATTGRATKVGFPTPAGTNDPTSSVPWTIAYPNEPASAVPATKAAVTAPWGKPTLYTLENGRAKQIVIPGVETVSADPALGVVPKDLATSFGYETDGRPNKVITPDGTIRTITYEKATDRLGKVAVRGVELSGTAGIDGAPKVDLLYGSSAQDGAAASDLVPTALKDARGREVRLGTPVFAGAGSPPPKDVPSGYVADSVTSKSTFDRFGRTLAHNVDEGLITTTYTYGAAPTSALGAGYLQSVDIGGLLTSLSYDAFGNLAEQRTPVGGSVFTYDAWDRPVRETRGQATSGYKAVDAKTERGFDAAGRLVKERTCRTPIGWVETTYEYNARDEIVKTTSTGLATQTPGSTPTGAGTTAYAYDPYGRITSVTTPALVVTRYTYDSAGRVASTQTGESGTRRVGYDEMGRVALSTDGHDGTWRGKHNSLGSLYEETLATGAVISRTFDAAGGLTSETARDGAGAILQKTDYETTSFGARSTVTNWAKLPDALGAGGEKESFSYSYDRAGRLYQITSTTSQGTRKELFRTFVLGNGLLLTESDAADIITSFFYSGKPLPTEVRQIDGADPINGWSVKTALEHDALGRVVALETGGTRTELQLDEGGHLLRSTAGGFAIEQQVDARGLVLQRSRTGTGVSARFGYDLDGRITTEETARETGSEITTYAYDTSGRLRTRMRPGPGGAETFEYFPDDTLRKATGRLVAIDYAYDAANRLFSRVPTSVGTALRGLAPLDGGDLFSYDALSRPLTLSEPSNSAAAVVYSQHDLRGLPGQETRGAWSGSFAHTYDPWGNAQGFGFAAGVGGGGVWSAYDALSRRTDSQHADAFGQPVQPSELAASFTWAGPSNLHTARTQGPGRIAQAFGYENHTGRLASEQFGASSGTLAGFTFKWDSGGALLASRSVDPTAQDRGLLAGAGWQWGWDGVRRLQSAANDRVTAGSGEEWTYGYGRGDELLRVTNTLDGVDDFPLGGPNARITERQHGDGSTSSFLYDLEGRRIEDDHFTYTYDWRGRLVQVDVRVGAELASARDHAGERVVYTYDAAGRLLTRTHLGAIPQGGTDNDRPFLARRELVWNGGELSAERGTNRQGDALWRATYLPGPEGADNAPLVRIESGIGTSQEKTAIWAYLRDEQGNVIAVVPDRPTPTPKARYLYTPYGEAHAEVGPELVRIRFDQAVTEVAGRTQTITPNETVPGALVIATTTALGDATLAGGITLEVLANGVWAPENPAGFALGVDRTGQLVILRLAGWVKATAYRITLTPLLADRLGRGIALPNGHESGFAIELGVPADGVTAPSLDRTFAVTYDSAEAVGNTLGGAFPGGQPHLFAGMWTDPVTGLALSGGEWLDTHNASWLAERASPRSTNAYAYAGWQPHAAFAPYVPALADVAGWEASPSFGAAPDATPAVIRLLNNPTVSGTMQVGAGLGEMGAGAAGILAPEPSLLTKIFGWTAAAHGADTLWAGIQALRTGTPQATLTQMGVQAGLQAIGMEEENAAYAASLVDALAGATSSAISLRGALGLGRAALPARAAVASNEAVYAPERGPGDGLGPGAAHISDPAFSTPRRIVMGQSMEARVKPWGRANNAKWYQAWRKNWHPNMTHDEMLAGWLRNRAWLDRQMRLGAEIFDIGPDVTKAPSPFYRLERLYLRKHNYPVTNVPGVP